MMKMDEWMRIRMEEMGKEEKVKVKIKAKKKDEDDEALIEALILESLHTLTDIPAYTEIAELTALPRHTVMRRIRRLFRRGMRLRLSLAGSPEYDQYMIIFNIMMLPLLHHHLYRPHSNNVRIRLQPVITMNMLKKWKQEDNVDGNNDNAIATTTTTADDTAADDDAAAAQAGVVAAVLHRVMVLGAATAPPTTTTEEEEEEEGKTTTTAATTSAAGASPPAMVTILFDVSIRKSIGRGRTTTGDRDEDEDKDEDGMGMGVGVKEGMEEGEILLNLIEYIKSALTTSPSLRRTRMRILSIQTLRYRELFPTYLYYIPKFKLIEVIE